MIGGTVNYLSGGYSEYKPVKSNTVNIYDGKVSGLVCGGLANFGSPENNAVHIIGGTINKGYIYGGWSENGSPSHNTVMISGNPRLQDTDIYGGYIQNRKALVQTGNVLEIITSGLTGINHIQGFETINFILPAEICSSEIVLTANQVDISNSKISVKMSLNGTPMLKEGDQIVLIKTNTSLIGTESFSLKKLIQVHSNALHYEFSLSFDQKNLYATVESVWKERK